MNETTLNMFWSSESEHLLRSLRANSSPVLVSGLGATNRAHCAAMLRKHEQTPLLVICADDVAAEHMQHDLSALLAEPVTRLGSRDFLFYSIDTTSHVSDQERIAAFSAMSQGAAVIVSSVAGLVQRSIPPKILKKSSMRIAIGQKIRMEELEDTLRLGGYVHRMQVDAPGQYARRGGLIDLFTPAYEFPVRIEFWGDEIDSMGFFDLITQRRTDSTDSCLILPASETLPTMFPGGIEALADDIMLRTTEGNRARKADHAQLNRVLRADAEKLRTTGTLTSADAYMSIIYPEFTCALDYLPERLTVFLDQPSRIAKMAEDQMKLLNEDLRVMVQSGRMLQSKLPYRMSWMECVNYLSSHFTLVMGENFYQGRYLPEPRSIVNINTKQIASYNGSLDACAEEARNYLIEHYAVMVLAGDLRRADVTYNYLDRQGLKVRRIQSLDEPFSRNECVVVPTSLSGGFAFPDSRLAVLTDTQIIQVTLRRVNRDRKNRNKKSAPGDADPGRNLASYTDLSPGDYVVHEHHGIGRFVGMVKMKVDGISKDYIKICYAGSSVLYVPPTQLDLVSKYVGAGEEHTVKLSKMGGAEWNRVKHKAKTSAKNMAAKLITLYAARLRRPGHAFPPDDAVQQNFEDSFGFVETDDQMVAIEEIKRDMESETPMDRLLCGDVGYGKTEVALRAVMKCIRGGMQAAILVPTTVLAQQHYNTAMQRFFGTDVRIDLLSRFRTKQQLSKTLTDLHTGQVDLIIGTHRLLQKDIQFKSLGLLVVDEEQRFGVTHKERLKELSKGIDVLTLSATPIPRTLNMAMSGLRDMSTLEEPPQNRLPVQTYVIEHDWDIIIDAIRRELQRGGQVYYLHNRVETIEHTAARIQRLLPGTSLAVAHGQMHENALSDVMESMSNGEVQILVCTTIIETGIDIPNVNTLIIENADRMGLAQLHQIRGRVGRSSRRASAYLTYQPGKSLNEISQKRLDAIREFAEFNAGFRIAMRDLEIRGAGNLLGAEQSGHMIDVGYEMYLKLLEEAVLEEKGTKVGPRTVCSADLTISANIPERYIPSSEQRMDLYRRIAMIHTREQADDLLDELSDRFGKPPAGVTTLVQVSLLRCDASKVGVVDISQKDNYLRFQLLAFDIQHFNKLCSLPEYQGKLRVDPNSQDPRIMLKVSRFTPVVETALQFIKTYGETLPPQEQTDQADS